MENKATQNRKEKRQQRGSHALAVGTSRELHACHENNVPFVGADMDGAAEKDSPWWQPALDILGVVLYRLGKRQFLSVKPNGVGWGGGVGGDRQTDKQTKHRQTIALRGVNQQRLLSLVRTVHVLFSMSNP